MEETRVKRKYEFKKPEAERLKRGPKPKPKPPKEPKKIGRPRTRPIRETPKREIVKRDIDWSDPEQKRKYFRDKMRDYMRFYSSKNDTELETQLKQLRKEYLEKRDELKRL